MKVDEQARGSLAVTRRGDARRHGAGTRGDGLVNVLLFCALISPVTEGPGGARDSHPGKQRRRPPRET